MKLSNASLPVPALPNKPRHQWWQDAQCKGMDENLFFPDRGVNFRDEVQQACGACPVRGDCIVDVFVFEQGLGPRPWGYVGGLVPGDRATLAAQWRAGALAAPSPTPTVVKEPPAVMWTKRCAKCMVTKSFEEFTPAKHTADKRESHCRACRREARNAAYARHKAAKAAAA